jgi:hypothetical protein
MPNSPDQLILIDPDADVWFGLPGHDLSLRMKFLSYDFDRNLSAWLLENVGALGEDWWVEIDREANSLRAVFRDLDVESWVTLAWCGEAESSA